MVAQVVSGNDGAALPPAASLSRLADPTDSVQSLPVSTLDGNALDIARTLGWKVVYFWSAECPCVKACEEYSLVPLAQRYAGKVTFYAVSADGFDLDKPIAELKKEAAAHKLPYSVVLDPTHATTRALNAEVTPQVFLIDPQNHIVYSGMPDDSKRYLLLTGKHGVTETYLSRAVREGLAGLPISQPHSELEGCIIAW